MKYAFLETNQSSPRRANLMDPKIEFIQFVLHTFILYVYR